jgi:hypothetical protein
VLSLGRVIVLSLGRLWVMWFSCLNVHLLNVYLCLIYLFLAVKPQSTPASITTIATSATTTGSSSSSRSDAGGDNIVKPNTAIKYVHNNSKIQRAQSPKSPSIEPFSYSIS